ncbi:hypothetical protein H4R99_008564, partial [Coemansia sp. RSA 1722]
TVRFPRSAPVLGRLIIMAGTQDRAAVAGTTARMPGPEDPARRPLLQPAAQPAGPQPPTP